MVKKYKSGYIVMKAYPLHNGHKYLIDTALENADKVTLLVCSLESENIPGFIRHNWAKEIYKDNDRLNIIHFDKEVPQYPEEDVNFWNIWVNIANTHCPDADVIFSSELYGEIYANKLGIANYLVDLDRKIVPISGTKIRNNPQTYWEYIPEIVKPYFVKRIAIMGPESAGKSTLTKDLAKLYNTNFVEEYGRIVYENNGNKVSLSDFIPISIGRQILEDKLVQTANKYLFCDTEDLTTWIFSKMYCPNDYNLLEGFFETVLKYNRHHLYILLKPDCNAVQDGTRKFLSERQEHYENIKSEMIERNYNFVEIGGDWQDRIEQIKQILSQQFETC